MVITQDKALSLVEAALQSRAIELTGTKFCTSEQEAQEIGKRDGAYLCAIFRELTKGSSQYS